jgi:hypothetical protein
MSSAEKSNTCPLAFTAARFLCAATPLWPSLNTTIFKVGLSDLKFSITDWVLSVEPSLQIINSQSVILRHFAISTSVPSRVLALSFVGIIIESGINL